MSESELDILVRQLDECKHLSGKILLYNQIISGVQLHLISIYESDWVLVEKLLTQSVSALSEQEQVKLEEKQNLVRFYHGLLNSWERSKNNLLADLFSIGERLWLDFRRHPSIPPHIQFKLNQIEEFLSPQGYWHGTLCQGHQQRIN